MAVTVHSVQTIIRAGLEAAYVAAGAGTIVGDGGNNFVNSGNEALHVINGSAGALALTIITPGTVDGQAVGDRVIAIAIGDEIFAGPWPVTQYGNPLEFEFDVVTSVTVAVLRL